MWDHAWEFIRTCLILLALLPVALAFLLVTTWIRERMSDHSKLRRRLRRTDHRRIGDAKEGALIKVVGRAKLIDRQTRGPLSGEPCLAYEISEWTIDEAGAPPGIPIEQRLFQEAVEFQISDESGSAIIDTQRVELALPHTSECYEPSDESVVSLLKRRARTAPAFESPSYYSEGLLRADCWVAVCGVAQWEVDTDSTNWSS